MSLILTVCATAWAGGFEVAQQGAAVGGMAHAGTAQVGQAESAWFNPAALADGGGFRFAGGLSIAHSRLTAEAIDGSWSGTSDTPIGTPIFAYASYAKADWSVSAAFNVPFGGGIRWPGDWEQRFVSVRSAPRYFRAAANFAYRIGPVRLGAGVHVDTGSLRVERATDHVSDEGYVTLLVRGTGVGGDGYLLAEVGPHATVGATYKSRTRLPMTGQADFDVPPVFAVGRADQAVSTTLTLPDRLTLGFAWTEERWRVAADVGLTLWMVNEEITFDFEQPETEDLTQQNQWRNALALRVGVAGHVHDRVELRGGAYVDGLTGAPPDPAYLSPSSPDSTRVAVTAGLGVQAHDVVRLDAFVEPLWLLRREAASDDLPEASYRGWAVAAGLGITIEAGGRKRVKAVTPEAAPRAPEPTATPRPRPAPEPTPAPEAPTPWGPSEPDDARP